jgi:hypothetical protein
MKPTAAKKIKWHEAEKLPAMTLAERITALEEEVNAELDRLAEERRPANVPAGVIRLMWLGKGGGNSFYAYLAAAKELGL